MPKETIKKGDIFNLKDALDDIPPNKEENIEISKKEAIKLMADKIKELRNKNYSFEEIADILSQRQFPVTARQLKQTLTRKRKYVKKVTHNDGNSTLKKAVTRKQSDKQKLSNSSKINKEVLKNDNASSSFQVKEDTIDI